MKRRFVAALTAFALLAQGFGMALASPALAQPPADKADAAMPCHGDAGASTSRPSAATLSANGDLSASEMPCDCCNGGCLFACGGAPLPATLSTGAAPAPDHPFPVAALAAPLASHALSPFRPPAA